jgi:hypothetical protein
MVIEAAGSNSSFVLRAGNPPAMDVLGAGSRPRMTTEMTRLFATVM